MSTQQENVAEKKDQVEEVTKKLDDLSVDNQHQATDEEKPQRRQFRGGRGGFRGRGRGGRGGRGRPYVPRVPYEETLKKIEEEQKSKKVLETGVQGRVKWFSVRGRYGFVAREGQDNEDFFVHQTAIAKSSTIKIYLRTLDDNEEVVFDIVEGRKGPEAANVTGPDGENVRGSRFSRQLLFRFRNGGFRRGGPRPRRNEGDRVENGDNNTQDQENEQAEGGEARPQKRRQRNRGRLAPDAPRTENGDEQNEQAVKQENGSGDAAEGAGEKKGNRRNNNKNRGKRANKQAGEPTEQKQEAEAVQA